MFLPFKFTEFKIYFGDIVMYYNVGNCVDTGRFVLYVGIGIISLCGYLSKLCITNNDLESH